MKNKTRGRAFKEAMPRQCRKCQGDANHQCLGGCFWVMPDLCSQCVDESIPLMMGAKNGH